MLKIIIIIRRRIRRIISIITNVYCNNIFWYDFNMIIQYLYIFRLKVRLMLILTFKLFSKLSYLNLHFHFSLYHAARDSSFSNNCIACPLYTCPLLAPKFPCKLKVWEEIGIFKPFTQPLRFLISIVWIFTSKI